MAEIPRAVRIRPAGTWTSAVDEVLLDYDQRFLRRRRLDSAAGESFLVDLPETVSLNHGDAFELEVEGNREKARNGRQWVHGKRPTG